MLHPRCAERVCPPGTGVPCVLRIEMAIVHLDFRHSSGVISSPSTRDVFLASCEIRVFSFLLGLHKPATPHGKSLDALLATLRSDTFHANEATAVQLPKPPGTSSLCYEGYLVLALLGANSIHNSGAGII
ncbi:hypothetical protein HPB50_011632 [Hyalomma asiaticum]|uniref:Uncharacterized protein n=1 Tax=Hyalomma asiaticum TaxID=266040 RepID=A0ACB7SEA4_HYAAI|nr:hypothetical protein HPB50_011632 [Hyalomma asiaticum]